MEACRFLSRGYNSLILFKRLSKLLLPAISVTFIRVLKKRKSNRFKSFRAASSQAIAHIRGLCRITAFLKPLKKFMKTSWKSDDFFMITRGLTFNSLLFQSSFHESLNCVDILLPHFRERHFNQVKRNQRYRSCITLSEIQTERALIYRFGLVTSSTIKWWRFCVLD